MKKEILKKFKEMKEKGQIIEFVDSELKEVFLEAALNGGVYGWNYQVLLSADGLSVAGPLDRSSMTMIEYQGKAIRVANIPALIEIDERIVDLNDVAGHDKKALIDMIISNEELKDEKELYEIDIDGYLQEINIEKYNELFKDYVEGMWETYRNFLIYDIYDNVDMKIGYEEI